MTVSSDGCEVPPLTLEESVVVYPQGIERIVLAKSIAEKNGVIEREVKISQVSGNLARHKSARTMLSVSTRTKLSKWRDAEQM